MTSLRPRALVHADFIPSVLAAWFPGVGLFARLPIVLLVAFLALFPLSFIKGEFGVGSAPAVRSPLPAPHKTAGRLQT